MGWPAILMYAVVAVGLLAARYNLTAAMLCVSWITGEAIWLATGDNLPLGAYFMADVLVVTAIYAKAIYHCGPKTYPRLAAQLKCMFEELTKWDRGVVAIFLLGMWPLYILNLHPYYKWWGLYALVIIQFLLACAEAALSFLTQRKALPAPKPKGNGFARVAGMRGYG